MMRSFVSVLIAMAVAMAPFGVAVAAPTDGDVAAAIVAAMPDCAGHAAHQDKTTPTDPDCGCCDTVKAACQSSTCMAKCFKLIGKLEAPNASAIIMTSIAYPTRPQKPPNWHSEPLPRPPQA